MTAIGITALLAGLLSGYICLGLDDSGHKVANWIVWSSLAAFIIGCFMTVIGILIWAWRHLP